MFINIQYGGRSVKTFIATYSYIIVESAGKFAAPRSYEEICRISIDSCRHADYLGRQVLCSPVAAFAVCQFYTDKRSIKEAIDGLTAHYRMMHLQGLDFNKMIVEDRSWMDGFHNQYSSYYKCLPHQLAKLEFLGK